MRLRAIAKRPRPPWLRVRRMPEAHRRRGCQHSKFVGPARWVAAWVSTSQAICPFRRCGNEEGGQKSVRVYQEGPLDMLCVPAANPLMADPTHQQFPQHSTRENNNIEGSPSSAEQPTWREGEGRCLLTARGERPQKFWTNQHRAHANANKDPPENEAPPRPVPWRRHDTPG